jgi:peroxiredoxin
VQARKSEFDRRHIRVIIVSFAQPAPLARYQEDHHWPFVVVADPERDAYRQFALTRFSWLQVFSPATLKLYWKLLRQGMKRSAYGREDIYQSGGDFLLDQDGNILFAHRSRQPADRPPASRLLQVIDELKPETRNHSPTSPENKPF